MVTRTSCPSCRAMGKDRSGDNLILFADGGEHCYSCGYHYSSTSKEALSKRLDRGDRDTGGSNGLHVNHIDGRWPSDTITSPAQIPRNVMKWLAKYGITHAEFQGWNLCYSPSLEMLIFPWMENDNVMFWIGRDFSDNPVSKYHTVGPVNKYTCVFQNESGKHDRVVAVEDFVSAIKVSRHADAMCYFSGNLRRNHAATLSKSYKHLIIWGDYDKAIDNIRLAKQYTTLFQTSRCIVTKKDPKDYTDMEIHKEIFK